MTSTALAMPERTSKLTFKTDMEQWAAELDKVAHRGFSAERILAGAMAAAVKTPQLFDCDPKSLFLALHRAARLGLDIGESGLYLVPLNQTIKDKRTGSERTVLVAECWADYRGLKLLAYRSRIVRHMDEFVVYEGDRFEYELGLDPRLVHQPINPKEARGGIRGAYTVVDRHGAPRTFHWLPIEEIEKRRAKSRSWGPKVVRDCPPWYAMKSVVRDYLGRQPKTPEMIEALAADDAPGDDHPLTEFDHETGEVRPNAPSADPNEDGQA